MACYKRILYIDYYEDGIKQTNVGFVKLIQWRKKDDISEREQTCFQIYVSNFLWEDEMECAIKIINNHNEILLGQVKMVSGKGMTQIKNLEEVLMSTDVVDDRDDILLRVELTPRRFFECILRAATEGVEKKAILEVAEVVEAAKEKITIAEVAEVEETEAERGESEESKPEENISTGCNGKKAIPRKILQVRRDKWQQLWEMYAHIRPFGDEREYLQIELQDLIVLSNMYYRLVENSFLLHGYYNYGHLILMKMYKRGRERIYIGVPGNYYEKEKQVAVMFGFESFEPKAEPAVEADFGYYLIGVDI